jgi:hypothetical protein
VPRYVTCELTHLITIFSNLYPFLFYLIFLYILTHSITALPAHIHTTKHPWYYTLLSRFLTAHTHTHLSLLPKANLSLNSTCNTFYQTLTKHTHMFHFNIFQSTSRFSTLHAHNTHISLSNTKQRQTYHFIKH